MKTSQADILILPGLGGGGPGYWYERWGQKLRTANRVEQKSWDNPDFDDWQDTIVAAVEQATQPVVLIAHSLGVIAAVHAAARFPHQKVTGGYFVAPPDIDAITAQMPAVKSFSDVPTAPLNFPSILVASSDDPYCSIKKAEDMSFAWGSKFESAGDSGHINADSGQGPWPEGLMSFATFMARL